MMPFGFRAGLSTNSSESAILALKFTVGYYTDRYNPGYPCFLNLSKAFDPMIWDKLDEMFGYLY